MSGLDHPGAVEAVSGVRDGWLEFNVNHKLRIRLTEAGRAALRRNHEELFSTWPNAPAYREPEADADGWIAMQAWQVMQELGPHIRMGAEVPFETTIQVELADTSDRQSIPGRHSSES